MNINLYYNAFLKMKLGRDGSGIIRQRSNSLTSAENNANPTAPMHIVAAFNEEGLGLVEWWSESVE